MVVQPIGSRYTDYATSAPDCLVAKPFVIFIQVGIYIPQNKLQPPVLTSPPCIFLPPGIGDLNLPVLHSALVAGVCFGVVIFILKRVRQDLVDLHMCHETRAMHGQQMLIMFPPL
jgi:hypothetical protein